MNFGALLAYKPIYRLLPSYYYQSWFARESQNPIGEPDSPRAVAGKADLRATTSLPSLTRVCAATNDPATKSSNFARLPASIIQGNYRPLGDGRLFEESNL
jgi:hypothetical protein